MIRANGRKIAYGVKHFVLDTFDDFSKLEGYVLKPSCTAFVINTSKSYILNSKFKWIEVKKLGGSSSGGGGNNSGDEDYDGGSIDGTDPDGSIDGELPGENPEYDGGSIDGTDPV